MARIIRNAQPSPITKSDRIRMTRAVAAYDARQAAKRRRERIARLACVACVACAVALGVALFYSATN